MLFQEDYSTQEKEPPQASGPRLFFRIIGQEAAAVMKLNLLFLLCCLPVITIPPALLALWQVIHRMTAEEAVRSWDQFWNAFRQGWKRGCGAFLLTAPPMTAAGYGAAFYLRFAADNPVWYVPFMFCAAVFLTALLGSAYLYGLLADGRKLTKETVLLALKLGLGKPLRAVLAAVSWYGALAAGILWFPLSGLWMVMAGFSLPRLLAQFFLRTVLERFGGAAEQGAASRLPEVSMEEDKIFEHE